MFSAILSAKRNTSCCTTPMFLCRDSCVAFLTSIPSMEILPSCHIIESRNQLTERCLSTTGRSDKRNRLTRFNMKGNILKHIMISFISKSDMININSVLLHSEALSHPEHPSAPVLSASVVQICADWLFRSQSVPPSLKAFVPDSQK